MRSVVVHRIVWPLFVSACLVLLMRMSNQSFWTPSAPSTVVGTWAIADRTVSADTPVNIHISGDGTASVLFQDDALPMALAISDGSTLRLSSGGKRFRYQLHLDTDTLTLHDGHTTYVFKRVFSNLNHPGLAR